MALEAPAPQGRVCWICLGNEIEPDSVDSGPFIKLCSCTLQAHEDCLLQWMLASRKPVPTCPQCGTKIVAVKKRQGVGFYLLKARKTLAAAAYFGISFWAYFKIGATYVRAMCDPIDACYILGDMPIPGLSPWANAYAQLINTFLVAGIPRVLLQRPKLGMDPLAAAVEPPLISLAMMFISRPGSQPIRWGSLCVAGLTHAVYRLVIDDFVLPRYGTAPVVVSEVPPLPAVLNLGRHNNEEDLEDVQRWHIRERESDRDVRRASVQLSQMFEHSRRNNDVVLDLVTTAVDNLWRDQDAQNDGADSTQGPGTPNDSDATDSEDEIRAQDHERPENEPLGFEAEPLLTEAHVLTLFLAVTENGPLDIFHQWSTDYTNFVRDLVEKVQLSGTRESLSPLVEAEVWKIVYWYPIRYLTSWNSGEQRKAILMHVDGVILALLKTFAVSDEDSWDPGQFEYLLGPGTVESTAEYVCAWFERRRERLDDPLHDVLVDEMINGIAEVDADAVALRDDQNRPQNNVIAPPNDAVQALAYELVRLCEEAASVVLFPFGSFFLSCVLEDFCPFSLSTTSRNLVAGGLVIVLNDLVRMVLARLQYRESTKWFIRRFDDLDAETRHFVQLQQNQDAL